MPLTRTQRRAALKKRGITVLSIARRLRVSHVHVGYVLKGERRSVGDKVERAIARALDLPLEAVYPPNPSARKAS